MGKRKYFIHNPTYFKFIDTEEKAYFLGFILGDGNLTSNNVIAFGLHCKDAYILQRLLDLIQGTYILTEKLTYDKRTGATNCGVQLSICCKELYYDILSHGIGKDKSKHYIFPTFLSVELQRHFIRGLFDADGSIGVTPSGHKYANLISTKEGLEKIMEITKNHNIKWNNHLHKFKNVENVYRICMGEDVLKLHHWLYDDSTIYLNRKYEKRTVLELYHSNIGFKESTTREVLVKNEFGEIIDNCESINDCNRRYKVCMRKLCKFSLVYKNNLIFEVQEPSLKKIIANKWKRQDIDTILES